MQPHVYLMAHHLSRRLCFGPNWPYVDDFNLFIAGKGTCSGDLGGSLEVR